MFDNIGEKIKTLASVICWIGIVLSVIGGIAVWVLIGDDSGALPFLLIAGVGSLLSWTGSFFAYGFGELIEKVSNIENTITPATARPGTPAAGSSAVVPQQNSQAEATANAQNTSEQFLGFLGNCEICGKTEILVSEAKIVDDLGTRYRKACKECFKKYNCN